MTGSDSPIPSNKVPKEYETYSIATPAETPHAKKRFSRFFSHHPKTSFPPGPKTSIGLALSLLGMAASSAMGIPNPYHRTGAILACAVALYIIGLRTPTPKG